MMCRRYIPLLLAALLLGSVAPTPCAAAQAANRTTLALFIAHADVPPYFMESDDPRGGGILVDVLKAVIGPLGYDFTTRRLPDKRGWDMLQSGDLNVYICAREWVENPDRFLWSDPVMPSEDVLLYRTASETTYTRPEDLYGLNVAGIKGFIYPALEPHFGPGKIIRLNAPTPDAMLKLLALGRADAVLVNRIESLWMFRNRPELEPQRFRMDAIPVDKAWYRFVFPKGHGWEPVVEQFNQRIEILKREGAFKAVLDHYR